MQTSPSPETTRTVGPWTALYRVLTAPTETFRDIAERPPIIPGYLLQIVALAAMVFVTLPLAMQVQEQMMLQTGEEGALSFIRAVAIATGAVEVLTLPWLQGLVLALVALFFGQFVGGGATFRQYFGMVGYAKVPLAVGMLIQAPLMAQAGSLSDLQHITLSAAALVPPDASVYLRFALMSLNPFALWYLALMAIGFAALHRTRWTRSLPLVITLFVVGTLMTMAQGAMQTIFSPYSQF